MGHNQPPAPTLLERLSETYATIFDAVEDLATKANSGPRVVKTSDDLNSCGILVTVARDILKQAEAARKGEKDQFLRAGKDVDAFFAKATDRLDRIKATFEGLATDYQRKVAAEARAAAEVAAARARTEEAARIDLARKAEEANRGKHAETHQTKADEAAYRAVEAEAVAQASAADLTRTRTASGALATAKTEWKAEIVNFEAVPLDKLRAYIKRDAIEAALRIAVKMGVREMEGVRFFEDVTASFR